MKFGDVPDYDYFLKTLINQEEMMRLAIFNDHLMKVNQINLKLRNP